MSGIINQVGARSGTISGGGSTSAGTVTLSGTTGLDYEEGEWGLTNTHAPSLQQCIYTRIGNLVRCSGYFVTNASTTSDSTWGDLPFAPVNFGNESNRAAGGIMYYNSSNNVGTMVANSNNTFRIYDGTTLVTLGTSTHIYFYLTYRCV